MDAQGLPPLFRKAKVVLLPWASIPPQCPSTGPVFGNTDKRPLSLHRQEINAPALLTPWGFAALPRLEAAVGTKALG